MMSRVTWGVVAVMLVLTLVSIASAGIIGASTASRLQIQPQPRPGSCHAIGVGIASRPDPRCTPGLVNPAVTQSTIGQTICVSGWTATVRPPQRVTAPEKRASMRAYGVYGTSRYEYDHFIPLELGGAVNAAGNLWPEFDTPGSTGFSRNPKDRLENALKHRVCSGAMTLAAARSAIVTNWVTAYYRYVGGPLR
jgi:hypothetical protein